MSSGLLENLDYSLDDEPCGGTMEEQVIGFDVLNVCMH